MGDLDDLSSLRKVLFDLGYTDANVAGLIKTCQTNMGWDFPSLLLLTERPQPLHRLVRLFVLGQPVSEAAIREVLAPFPLERLVSAGLIQLQSGGTVISPACLMPYENVLFLRDFGADWTGRTPAQDFVMGVSQSSISLATTTVRREGEKVLDLGTGGGIQAILAGVHARQVIATDISPRALSLAGLALRINGIDNVTLRQGSMFDPVRGETFDLIVSQPPFVISPENTKTFRDSGMPGDTFCEAIIRQVPDYLRADGWSSIMFSWGHRDEGGWPDRPRSWVEGCDCDVWIIRLRSDDVFSYAIQWVRGLSREREDSDLERVRTWLAYYEQFGFEMISTGVVVFHKRTTGKNWIRVDALDTQDGRGSCGPQIQNIFAAESLLRSLPGPEALLDLKLRLAEETEMQQTLIPSSGSWQIQNARVNHRRGFAFPVQVDGMSAELLSGFDGKGTLRSVVEALAQRFSLEGPRLFEEAIPVAVRLMRNGYLVPA